MTRFHNVCVLIILSVGYAAAKPTCGPNELLDDCPKDCSYDFCPKDELQDRIECLTPKTCPPPACKCGFNFRRADNGTCIATQNCPPFDCSRENEIYDPCPSWCPGDDCSNANPTGECPFFSFIVINCSPSCRCKPDYWRNNGKCVPYLKCPHIQELLLRNDRGIPEIKR